MSSSQDIQNIQNQRAIAATPVQTTPVQISENQHKHRPGGPAQSVTKTISIDLASIINDCFSGDFAEKKEIYGFANKKLSSLYDSEFAKPHTLAIRTGNRFPRIFAELANQIYDYSPSYIAGVGISNNAAAAYAEANPIKGPDSIIITTADIPKISGYLTTWIKNRLKSKQPITYQALLEVAEEIADMLDEKNHSNRLSKVAIDLYLPGAIAEIKLGGDLDTGKLVNTLVKNFILPWICLGKPEIFPYYCIISRTCKPGSTLALERVLDQELLLTEGRFFQKFFPCITYEQFKTTWEARIDQLTATTYCPCEKQLAGHWNFCPSCGLEKS